MTTEGTTKSQRSASTCNQDSSAFQIWDDGDGAQSRHAKRLHIRLAHVTALLPVHGWSTDGILIEHLEVLAFEQS